MSAGALRALLRAWGPLVLGNLLLGAVAVVPLGALWLFAVEWPFAALGLTQREATDNDGILPWLMLLLPLELAFLLLWIPSNHWMLRRSRLPRGRYWTASILLTLAPFAITAQVLIRTS